MVSDSILFLLIFSTRGKDTVNRFIYTTVDYVNVLLCFCNPTAVSV